MLLSLLSKRRLHTACCAQPGQADALHQGCWDAIDFWVTVTGRQPSKSRLRKRTAGELWFSPHPAQEVERLKLEDGAEARRTGSLVALVEWWVDTLPPIRPWRRWILRDDARTTLLKRYRWYRFLRWRSRRTVFNKKEMPMNDFIVTFLCFTMVALCSVGDTELLKGLVQDEMKWWIYTVLLYWCIYHINWCSVYLFVLLLLLIIMYKGRRTHTESRVWADGTWLGKLQRPHVETDKMRGKLPKWPNFWD